MEDVVIVVRTTKEEEEGERKKIMSTTMTATATSKNMKKEVEYDEEIRIKNKFNFMYGTSSLLIFCSTFVLLCLMRTWVATGLCVATWLVSGLHLACLNLNYVARKYATPTRREVMKQLVIAPLCLIFYCLLLALAIFGIYSNQHLHDHALNTSAGEESTVREYIIFLICFIFVYSLCSIWNYIAPNKDMDSLEMMRTRIKQQQQQSTAAASSIIFSTTTPNSNSNSNSNSKQVEEEAIKHSPNTSSSSSTERAKKAGTLAAV